MEHNTFHKALEIQRELCIGCSHCIKVCPTEALRVSGGKASSDECLFRHLLLAKISIYRQ